MSGRFDHGSSERGSGRRLVPWLLAGLAALGLAVSALVGGPGSGVEGRESHPSSRTTAEDPSPAALPGERPEGSDTREETPAPGPEGGVAEPEARLPVPAPRSLETDEVPADRSSDASRPRGSGETSLDRDELTDLGELGFLPGLVQALSPASDCVFDDALSTCQ